MRIAVLASESALSTTAVVVSLIAAAVLILLNGFFVAYEFAVVAARVSAFEDGPANRGPVARAARASLRDLNMQLAGAQLGITMASLALGRVGEPALETIIEALVGESLSPEAARALSFLTALAVFTFLHLVIGEMVPKNIALAAPEPTMRWLVLPYRFYLLLFRPIVSLLNGIANGGCRLVGIEPRDELMSVHTASELASIITYSQQGGAIEADDAQLLHGAIHFAMRPVAEIATPMHDYASVVLGATAAQLERKVADTGQHRILVLSPAGLDEPVGYVHARDLLEIPAPLRTAPIPASFVRKMAVVRGDRALIEVLRMLRRVGRQLAVIRDGDDIVGIVSVEEVIRALVEPQPEPKPLEADSTSGEETRPELTADAPSSAGERSPR